MELITIIILIVFHKIRTKAIITQSSIIVKVVKLVVIRKAIAEKNVKP